MQHGEDLPLQTVSMPEAGAPVQALTSCHLLYIAVTQMLTLLLQPFPAVAHAVMALAQYCDCFAAGVYCNNCQCASCQNTVDNK